MRQILVFVCFLALPRLLPAQPVFPVRDEGEAPSRSYHVVHYKIEVSVDEAAKRVTGTVTTTLVPFLPDFRNIEFDAEKMEILRASLSSGRPLRFDTAAKKLVLHLDKPYSIGDTLTVSVAYTCTPKRGLYFTQPDSGYPDKPSQIWSQGEDMDNHFWFPCYDFPNDKATSEMYATVRSGYTALSNGELAGVKENKKEGTKTFHWIEKKPHASYLITLAAGDYAILHDRAGNVPLEYYVYPRDTADARICFSQTPAMVKFFGEKIGYPYAWEKYAQVLIADFIEGGMENTSATSLLDWATVYDARRRVDNLPTSLIAHELAHQWWGDVVTCKDWRHLWLNESFASYFDPLYHEYAVGVDDFRQSMLDNQQAGIFSDTGVGRKPIVSVGSYGINLYPRGAAVLHMLRYVLGDRLFWKSLNHYITKNQFTPVETNDLKVAIEEATGQNLHWFFDEWVYKAGHPVFSVTHRWSDSARAVLLTVRQTQKLDSLTGVFRTPVDIAITSSAGTTRQRVTILSGDTTFVLPTAEKPRLVAFDPDDWILKELAVDQSDEEWSYQAEHDSSAVNRVQALRTLSGKSHAGDFAPLFARAARRDPFWGVRREAVNALGKIKKPDESIKPLIADTLIAASADPKPSVRSAALSQLAKSRGANVVAALMKGLEDSSYSVVSAALGALADADSAGAEATLTAYLGKPSHRNGVANAALSALVKVDSTKGISEAIEDVRYGKPVTTRFTALSILHRHLHGRRDVEAVYRSLMNDKDQGIRSRALQAVGEFGDETVLPGLEKIAADKEDQAAGTAKASIEKIKERSGAKK
jgi:aminopeptidase N